MEQSDEIAPGCHIYAYGYFCELPLGHSGPHQVSGTAYAEGTIRWRCHAWGNEVIA